MTEMECPCEEASPANCTICQDLPEWYFDALGYSDLMDLVERRSKQKPMEISKDIAYPTTESDAEPGVRRKVPMRGVEG